MTTDLGDLISAVYEEFLTLYNGDAEAASVATAAVVNDVLAERDAQVENDVEAA